MPIPRTPLIGREAEIATARAFLLDEAVPLLTLIGLGGSGKTRLALAVAQDIASAFGDGVAFVDLSVVSDPALLPSVIAGAIGLSERGAEPIGTQLRSFLRSRQLLLVLDNCEHLVEGVGALVSDWLITCPALQVLVTSRSALRIRGEHELPVLPLTLPEVGTADIHVIEQSPAVSFFVERARAIRPSFVLTDGNATTVAAICHRLDGLPLAIELATSWSKVLSPSALLARLDERLIGLTGGPRDLPARQQTVRATIQWSYDLLPPREQALLRLLAAFSGGFTLPSAEAVSLALSHAHLDVVEGMAVLVNASLLQAGDGHDDDGWFHLLETVRAFGLEQLRASGEEIAIRNAHAGHFLELAETADRHHGSREHLRWLERVEREHDNVRAALAWSFDGGDPQIALQLAGALWRHWRTRGNLAEGRTWLERALAVDAGQPSRARAKALYGLGSIVDTLGEPTRAGDFGHEALSLSRALGDASGIIDALVLLGRVAHDDGNLPQADALFAEALALAQAQRDADRLSTVLNDQGAVAQTRGDYTTAKALFEEGLSIQYELEDVLGAAILLGNLGQIVRAQGDLVTAQRLLEESLDKHRSINHRWGICHVLNDLGELAFDLDDTARAKALHSEALQLQRELGSTRGIGGTLLSLARIAHAQDDLAQAESLYREGLRLCRKSGDMFLIAAALSNFAEVLLDQEHDDQAAAMYRESLALFLQLESQIGVAYLLESIADLASATQPAVAARLIGAARAIRKAIGAPLPPRIQANRDADTADIRAQVGDTVFATAIAAGRTLTWEQAAAEAMSAASELAAGTPPNASTTAARSDGPLGLSQRELEVLGLLSQRLTNNEIAERLFIGTRTVQTHTISIFTKLGVDNRRDAAAAAVRHGLA